MLRYLSLMCLLLLTFATGSDLSAKPRMDAYPSIMQQISTYYQFDGDRHKQFAGNPVIVLSDGSSWKVHPQDIDMLSHFSPSDWVHVAVRTSWYWFKREHKFELVNHNNGSTIRVMLVRHKTVPLYIAHSEKFVSSYATYKTTTESRTETTTVPVFSKKLTLSDGSHWILSEKTGKFSMGNNVIVAANFDDGHFESFYIINGTQRDALHAKVKPYFY